ncbi:MAG TPA: NFACT family protein, partial [Spirochaetia bacterium]|nr:NFACT family protein [Spirochaetia bacterium]
MALNWREIDLILEELALGGSIIRQINGPDHQRLVLDLYRHNQQQGGNFRVLIALSNPHCRIHRLSQKLENPKSPPRFAAFLRAHIRNGRIVSAEQINSDRIIKMVIVRGDREYFLFTRLWTNAANVILTDSENTILDAFYRRPQRGEVSGGTFRIQERKENARKDSFTVTELPGGGSFNERVEEHYSRFEAGREKDMLKSRIMKDLDIRENNAAVKLEGLKQKLEEVSDPGRWKETGDLIMSSLHRIEHGSQWLKTEDFFNSDAPIEIELDTRLSPVQNAERFYAKYKKARKSLDTLNREIELLSANLKEISEKKKQVSALDDLDAFKTLHKRPQQERRRGTQTPGLIFSSSHYRIIVGKTAKDNDLLLRQHVNGNDYWLHTRDYPGA